jgi:hypothetical protein
LRLPLWCDCRTSKSIATRRILSAIWRALRWTAERPAAAEMVWIKLHGGAVDWTVRSAPRSRRTRERLPAVDHDCLLIDCRGHRRYGLKQPQNSMRRSFRELIDTPGVPPVHAGLK